jgi:hypothetical protein
MSKAKKIRRNVTVDQELWKKYRAANEVRKKRDGSSVPFAFIVEQGLRQWLAEPDATTKAK